MSDKLLRVDEAATLYNDIRERIKDVNTTLSSKVDTARVEDGYLILEGDGNLIASLTGFGGSGSGGGGGGGGGKSNISIKNAGDWTSKTISFGSECPISFTWSSTETDGGASTGNGSLKITINGEVKYTQDQFPQTTTKPYTFDLKDYLISGVNNVRIFVTDTYSNQSFIAVTVTANAYTIKSDFNKIPQTYRDSIVFTYTATGLGSKTIHFEVKPAGSSSFIEVGTQTTQDTNHSDTFTFTKDMFEHGSNSIRVYYTILNSGIEVSSNKLNYTITYVKSDKPIISSSFSVSSANQYDQLTIPYQVYSPEYTTDSENAIYAKMYIKYGDGAYQAYGDTVKITSFSENNFYYTIENGNPNPADIDVDTNLPNNFNLYIKIDAVVKGVSVVDDPVILIVNVKPAANVISAVTTNLELFLSAAGRSNSNTETRNIWKYNDISATFSDNFNWTTGGWVNKSETILNGPGSEDDVDVTTTVLRISPGSRVTIPYKMFHSNHNAAVKGKTIEFEFATLNVDNYDTKIIECFSEMGFTVTAQQATFNSVGCEVYSQFKEEEHVRVSIAIEAGNRTEDSRLIYIYVNGIMSGVKQHQADDTFIQSSAVGITLGSDDATLDIYNIRVYDTFLSRDQIVTNWIADKQDGNDKSATFKRNKLFGSDNIVNGISFDNFKDNLPDLPYMVLDCPMSALPQSKGDKKTISGKFVDNQTPERCFTFKDASADVQGTSSAGYPRKNYKFKFKDKGFTATNVTTKPSSSGNVDYFKGVSSKDTTTWGNFRLTKDGVATNTFTFKADYASSEGCNNVELVRLYNDLAKSINIFTPPQEKDSTIRVGIDGFPMAIFTTELNGTYRFVGKYNFNNDKGTEKVYGLSYHNTEFDKTTYQIKSSSPSEIVDESWETGDNSSVYTRWHDYPTKNIAFTLLGNSGKGDGIYEARFPSEWQDAHDKTSTESLNYTRFINLMKWVSSTDTNDYNSIDFPRGVKTQYVALPDAVSGKTLSLNDDLSDYYISEQKTYTKWVHPDAIAKAGTEYYEYVNDGYQKVTVSTGDVVTGYYEKVIGYIFTACASTDKAVAGVTYYSTNTGTGTVASVNVGDSVSGKYTRKEDITYKEPDAIAIAGVTYHTRAYNRATSSYVYTPVTGLKIGTDVVTHYYISKQETGTVYTKATGKYNGSGTYYMKTGEKLATAVQYEAVYVEVIEGITPGYKDDNGVDVPGSDVSAYYVRNSNGTYTKATGTADSTTTYYELTTPTYYYDDADYRKAKFTQELANYFDVDATVYYYVFTEFFLEIDSRVKNSFPTYFAKTESYTDVHTEWIVTKDKTAVANKNYKYKDKVYIAVDGSKLIYVGSSVSSYYTKEGDEYTACAEGDLAVFGTKYYSLNETTSQYSEVTKDITYPTDVSGYYVTTDNTTYTKATNPIVNGTNYFSMKETGEEHTVTLEAGTALDDRTYYSFENVETTKHREVTDDDGLPVGRWTWLPYDMDTALGINNEGALVFSYDLEDTDIIDGTTEVFNGQDSVLWNNLRECFGYEISSMYAKLRSTVNQTTSKKVFDYDRVEGMFDDHQYHWPANLFNEDSHYKYIIPLISPENNAQSKNYLDMLQGSKEQQRKWWMFNRFRYVDSKYTAADSNDKFVYFRSYNGGKGEVGIVPYSNIYVHFLIGRAINVVQRAVRNETVTIDLNGFEPNDTETYIYSADLIKEIKGLSDLMVDALDITSATRLSKLQIDGFHWKRNGNDYEPVHENTKLSSLSVHTNINLTELRVTDCPKLESGGDLSALQKLVKLNLAGNETMTTVTLPVGGVLKEVYLPYKLSTLIIKDQPYITTLSIVKRTEELELGTNADDTWASLNDNEKLELDYGVMNDVEYVHRYVDVTSSYFTQNYFNITKFNLENVSSAVQDQTLDILYKMAPGKWIRLIGFNFTFDTELEFDNFFKKLDGDETAVPKILPMNYLNESGVEVSWDSENGAEDCSNAMIGVLTSDTLTLSYEKVMSHKNKYKSIEFNYNIEKTVSFYHTSNVEPVKVSNVSYKFEPTTVTYTGIKPTKADTSTVHYVFDGWSETQNSSVATWKFNESSTWEEIDAITGNITQEIDNITKNTSLYPVFREVPIYTVHIYGYRGNNEETDLFMTKTIIGGGEMNITGEDTSKVKTTIKNSSIYSGHALGSNVIISSSNITTEVIFNGWTMEPYGGVMVNFVDDETKKIIQNVHSNLDIYESFEWPVESISIDTTEKTPKVTYFPGDNFERDTVYVKAKKTVIASNGSIDEQINEITDYTLSINAPLSTSDTYITFTYKDKTVTLDLYVASKVEVTKDSGGQLITPTRAYYIINSNGMTDNWEPAGLSLTVTYSCGSQKETEIFDITNENASTYISWTPKVFNTTGIENVIVTMISPQTHQVTSISTTVEANIIRGIAEINSFSWSEIKAIAAAGLGDSYWNIGDEKYVDLNSTNSSYTSTNRCTFRILGFDHNASIETSGKHSITFGLAKRYDVVANGYDFTIRNARLYSNESLTYTFDASSTESMSRTVESLSNGTSYLATCCRDIYNMLPEDCRNSMMNVKKYQLDAIDEDNSLWLYKNMRSTYVGESGTSDNNVYLYTNNVSSEIFGDNGLCPVFIPSLTEVMGVSNPTTSNSNKEADYCKQYAYFKYGSVDTVDETEEATQNWTYNGNPSNFAAVKFVSDSSSKGYSLLSAYVVRTLSFIMIKKYTTSGLNYRYYVPKIIGATKLNIDTDDTPYVYIDRSSVISSSLAANENSVDIIPCFVVG